MYCGLPANLLQVLGFVHQTFSLTALDTDYSDQFTLMAFSGDTRLFFAEPEVFFDSRQIGNTHVQSIVVKNGGTRAASFMVFVEKEIEQKFSPFSVSSQTVTLGGNEEKVIQVQFTPRWEQRLHNTPLQKTILML